VPCCARCGGPCCAPCFAACFVFFPWVTFEAPLPFSVPLSDFFFLLGDLVTERFSPTHFTVSFWDGVSLDLLFDVSLSTEGNPATPSPLPTGLRSGLVRIWPLLSSVRLLVPDPSDEFDVALSPDRTLLLSSTSSSALVSSTSSSSASSSSAAFFAAFWRLRFGVGFPSPSSPVFRFAVADFTPATTSFIQSPQ